MTHLKFYTLFSQNTNGHVPFQQDCIFFSFLPLRLFLSFIYAQLCMLHHTRTLGWKVNSGGGHRGGKNLAWAPKQKHVKLSFVRTDMSHPRRRPTAWHKLEFKRLGYHVWPKEVGFWNAGDNWELTPEFSWRFYLHNLDKEVWTQGHNEQTIIALLPLVEVDPESHLPRIHNIWQHHVTRFGPDHIIYNAVTQAFAFCSGLRPSSKYIPRDAKAGVSAQCPVLRQHDVCSVSLQETYNARGGLLG